MKRRNLLKNLALGIATAVTGVVAYTHRGPKTEIGGIAGGSQDHRDLPRGRQFLIGNRVRIDSTLPWSMSHFEGGYEAIISKAGLSQNEWSYGVLILKNGVPSHRCAWYPESVLTLIDDDCNTGCALLAWYDENR